MVDHVKSMEKLIQGGQSVNLLYHLGVELKSRVCLFRPS